MQFTDEKEERIIRESMKIFLRLGIKSVNMDDIAARLGMSKKTLYKYVNDKVDLVKRVFHCHVAHETEQMKLVTDRNLNAIDEAFEMMRMVISMVKDINPVVIFDMHKFYPELMQDMECQRSQLMWESLKSNLLKGIEEGYYREDLNVDFIVSLYVSAIKGIFEQLGEQPTELSFGQLYLELFRYHIRGIASEKGLQYLIEKVNQERQNQVT